MLSEWVFEAVEQQLQQGLSRDRSKGVPQRPRPGKHNALLLQSLEWRKQFDVHDRQFLRIDLLVLLMESELHLQRVLREALQQSKGAAQ